MHVYVDARNGTSIRFGYMFAINLMLQTRSDIILFCVHHLKRMNVSVLDLAGIWHTLHVRDPGWILIH